MAGVGPVTGAEDLAQRGELHRRAHRYEEALADFTQVLAVNPENAWALARHASVRLLLAARRQQHETCNAFDLDALRTRYQPILVDIDRALMLAPDDLWTRCQRIDVLRCMKDLPECRNECTRMIEQNPGFPWAYRRRAWAHRWLLDYDRALADVEEALRLCPDDTWSMGYRALLYGMMRRFEESLLQFDRVMSVDNALIEPWTLERGIILFCAARYEEATVWLARGLSRRDGHLARYFIAIARVIQDGEAGAEVEIDIVRHAAAALLSTEGRAIAEYMLAGLAVIAGDVPAAVQRLEPVLGLSDMIIETALCDAIVRPVCKQPRLKSVIEARIDQFHPARKYLPMP
jgi:tetratricopeptide (TPR) repeat protein